MLRIRIHIEMYGLLCLAQKVSFSTRTHAAIANDLDIKVWLFCSLQESRWHLELEF